MSDVLAAVLGALGFLVLLFALAVVTAIPTYFLWNWLMPSLFNLKMIGLFEAWGINVLSGILFKSASSSK